MILAEPAPRLRNNILLFLARLTDSGRKAF